MHVAPETFDSPLKMPSVARVRAHYASLCGVAVSQFRSASLGGRLLLIDGLNDEGDALLIAASIAGAASLVLETRAEMVRHCVRNGIVDFAVNTLDESLRILKNEIRKGQPIAVLLEKEQSGVLAEMVERGAQPNLIRWPGSDTSTRSLIETLTQRGAHALSSPSTTPDPTRDTCWRANDGGSAVLRQLDLLAGEILPQDDAERQNWVSRAPRYLPRALRLERRVTMSEEESAAFLTAVKERGDQKALAAPVIVLAGGHDYKIAP